MKVSGKKKKRARPSIQMPSLDDIEEAARTLHLDNYGRKRLAQVVGTLAAQIRQKIAKGSYDVVKLRAQKKKLSETLQKQLAPIVRTLRNPKAQALNALLAPDLAALLSTAAFERAVGENIGDCISTRDLILAQRSRSPYRVLETEAESIRRVHAEVNGVGALATTIGLLASRIERARSTALQRNIGGAEPDHIRRDVLLGLMNLHNEFSDRYGKRWGKKRYFELAEIVLAALGQSTDGLEQAIRRLMKAIGAKWNDP